ncbi:Hpt domain-containing protein, partial [candidate division CSSED10-310 bacterium]
MAFDRMKFVRKFSIEAKEHIEKISNGLMELEKSPDNTEILQEIFRSAHTLKGSARMLKLLDINKIAHKMEDLLGMIKERKLPLSAEITDLLLENCDAIDECLNAALEQQESGVNVDDHVARLEKAMKKEPFQLKAARQKAAEASSHEQAAPPPVVARLRQRVPQPGSLS